METRRNFINPMAKSSLILAGVFIFMTSAGPDKNTTFDDWDTDNDNKITQTEVSDGLFSEGKNDAGLFDDDDKDMKGLSDQTFNEDTFYESSYDWWDANDDQQLDETEWGLGYENSFGDYIDEDFDTYDTDNDSYLGYDEYRDSFNDTDYFSDWDANDDDVLDNEEYSTGIFDTWDANDDNYIDENEFDDFDV